MIRALTICQPHAHYVALPDDDPAAKRVENRVWRTDYRGYVAIHAGASRAWLDSGDFPVDRGVLVFSAVLCIARLRACIHIDTINRALATPRCAGDQAIIEDLGWVLEHAHTTGPICWVFDSVRILEAPMPARGARGLWEWTPPGPLRFRSAPSVPSVASV